MCLFRKVSPPSPESRPRGFWPVVSHTEPPGSIAVQLAELARRAAEMEARAVTDAMIVGRLDRLEVSQGGGRSIVYTVPSWRRHPFKRLLIAWLRWRSPPAPVSPDGSSSLRGDGPGEPGIG